MVSEIKVQFNVPAIMRDGAILYANIFRPADEGLYPVALSRTPYAKDFSTSFIYLDMVRLAREGYIVVVQDVRGRFNSEGLFSSLWDGEAEDGYDSVEWAAGLPGSNGNVGMWGISYLGFAQWAAASLNPPHLKAIMPGVTWSDARKGMWWRGGALELGILANILVPSLGADVLIRRLAGKPELGSALQTFVRTVDGLGQEGYKFLPIKDLPAIRELDLGGETLDDLVTHPYDLKYSRSPLSNLERCATVSVPAYNLGGWYDIFTQGTLDNFVTQRQEGATPASRQAKLIIGPWSHINYTNQIGDLDFGMRAQMAFIDGQGDLVALTARWFDYWLKGLQNGILDEPPVKIFVMGANTWRESQEWPLKETAYLPYYLQPDMSLGLPMPPAAAAPSLYCYDPADPAPTWGGNVHLNPIYGIGPKDQRLVEARSDVLTYTSAPLKSPLEVIGPVKVHLWAASSSRDTDFIARLVDVHPDGYAQNICDGIIRARYRNGDVVEFLEPGRAYEFEIDLWSTANVFLPGHCIRVDVTSSSFPRWDRNLNTEEPFGLGNAPVKANQTIFHDADHPSRIILPVIKP